LLVCLFVDQLITTWGHMDEERCLVFLSLVSFPLTTNRRRDRIDFDSRTRLSIFTFDTRLDIKHEREREKDSRIK
jgi:hypothetical protein